MNIEDEKFYHIILETHIHAHERFNEKIPESIEQEELWIGDKYFIHISNKRWLIVNLVDNKLFFLDPQLKLYTDFSLPLDLLQCLTKVARLQYKNGYRNKGKITKTNQSKKINNFECEELLIVAEDMNRTTINQWITNDVPFNLENYYQLIRIARRFQFPNYDDLFHKQLDKETGFPIYEEIGQIIRGKELRITREVKDIKEENIPSDIIDIPKGYTLKEKISYQELITQELTPLQKYSPEQEKIIQFLHYHHDWYLNRDINRLDEWITRNFTENTFIIGTIGVFPGEFEWRKGIQAAKEIYANDYYNKWNLRLFIEEADIEIDFEGQFAWVVVFGLVTRKATDHESRSSEASRKRSLARIKSYTETEWDTKRALYEVIHDASMILVQYERGEIFYWPVRCTFNLKKVNSKWKINQLHYSWSGSGFPAVRLFDSDME
ncbi:MAG: hypothetical protein HGN29_17900 [Asgard group archaeon]|nr:hypothetical protein [Asgard group archaeon]